MSDENKTLADYQQALLGSITKTDEGADAAITVVHEHPQPVSKIRHWRQRFAGVDGDYIFRKGINIRGKDGKMRRARAGDPVDVGGDGISPRRLKSLWYSEMIEVAAFDRSKQNQITRRVVTRDNLAVRQREAAIEAAAVRRVQDERVALRRARDRQRSETRQRRLAEQAVIAAEQAEERELARMEADERAEERVQEAVEELQQLQEREREDAAAAVIATEEARAQTAEKAFDEAIERDAQDEAAQEATRQHFAEKAERSRVRKLAEDSTRRSAAERDKLLDGQKKSVNPNNKSLNAKEARKILRTPGSVPPRPEE